MIAKALGRQRFIASQATTIDIVSAVSAILISRHVPNSDLEVTPISIRVTAADIIEQISPKQLPAGTDLDAIIEFHFSNSWSIIRPNADGYWYFTPIELSSRTNTS